MDELHLKLISIIYLEVMGHKPDIQDQLLSKQLTRWAIALAVAATLATTIVAIYSVKSASDRTKPASTLNQDEQPAIDSVTALGRLEPDGEVIRVSASGSLPQSAGARVAQVLVSQGDEVRANQVIAVLDNRDRLQAALERAQKQVQVAQANLDKVRAGAKTGVINAQEATIKRLEAELKGEKDVQKAKIDGLKTQLTEAEKAQNAVVSRLEAELNRVEKDFEQRYTQLGQNGAISASELDSRKLSVETARERLREAQASRNQILANLRDQLAQANVNRDKTIAILDEQIKEAKANLEQIKEIRPVDIQQAKAEVESAQSAVDQAQADLELAYVRAPVPGRILKINTRAGETVNDSEGIAELGQTDQMMVVAEVYESDISKVRLGQRVTMTSEGQAFEGELRGSVNKIGLKIGKKDVLSTDPAAATDARVVEVNIRLNPEDSKRVAGLTYSKVIVKIFL
jgi:HlyD family secretion protein